MSYDFCLGCGVLLNPHIHECPVCGFDNDFGEYEDDTMGDDFLIDLHDDFDLDGDVV